jgi:hypothetical protein
MRDLPCGHRRHVQSLEALYHKLPSALRTSVEHGFPFFHRSTLNRILLTLNVAHLAAQPCSDHLSLQSRPLHHVSPDLYTIFTNEDAQTATDKDADKKVRLKDRHRHWHAG